MTDPPNEISDLFKRPGATWSRAERDRVVEWLFAERLRWLLAIASKRLRYYSRGVALPDGVAGDVVNEFLGVTTNRVMDYYEPSTGSMSALIATAVSRLARDTAKKVWLRDGITVPPVNPGPDGTWVVIDLPDEGIDGSPEERLIAKERGEALRRCIDQLRPKARTVVLLRLEEVPYAEVAELVGLTAKTAKQTFFHSKPILRDCLQKHARLRGASSRNPVAR